MFKQLSPSVTEELKGDGRVVLTVKGGWETATMINSIPYKINLYIRTNVEHMFNCYLQDYSSTLLISNITPAPAIAAQKSIIDSYLYIAINGLIQFAKMRDKNRVIVDTTIKCAADHLPHYGFKLFSETTDNTNSIQGILSLK
jgi:hypothetical protein